MFPDSATKKMIGFLEVTAIFGISLWFLVSTLRPPTMQGGGNTQSAF